jgi:hypothetical protein
MNDWEILGIAPTQDPREIKRAYSRALRIYHPEKDPEGFQRLRAAYERLIAYMPNWGIESLGESQENLDSPRSIQFGKESQEISADDSVNDRANSSQEEMGENSDIPDSFENLNNAWDDFWLRSDQYLSIHSWKIFLSRHELWDLNIKNSFSWQLLSTFETAYHENHLDNIPVQSWLLLDHTFDWHSHELQLSKVLDDDFVDFLMLRIRKAGALYESENYPKVITKCIAVSKPESKFNNAVIYALLILFSGVIRECNNSNNTPPPQAHPTANYRTMEEINSGNGWVENVVRSKESPSQYMDQGAPIADSTNVHHDSDTQSMNNRKFKRRDRE